jgi:hypothetical protein
MSEALLEHAAQLRRDRKHEQARVLLTQEVTRMRPTVERAQQLGRDGEATVALAARMHYDLACTHDYLGEEAQAWPHYQSAMALGLPAELMRGCLLGAGSTARNINLYSESEALLRKGFQQYGLDSEFAPFLALTLHSQGRQAEALSLAIQCISKTSNNPDITQFNRALAEYAQLLCSPSSSVA